MSDYRTLRYEVDSEAILTLTLDRPEALNAFTVPPRTFHAWAVRAPWKRSWWDQANHRDPGRLLRA